MKTPEELNALKEETETVNAKLAELSEEELEQITGGVNPIIGGESFAGVEYDGLNLKDIVPTEVLKDASATAIYGARGANGVILVE